MVTLYNIQVTDYILLFVIGISLNVTFNQVLLGSSPRRTHQGNQYFAEIYKM